MSARRVLSVCTGNLCRSPLAAALLQRALERRGAGDVQVTSAGTSPAHGIPLPPATLAAAQRRGLGDELLANVPQAIDLETLPELDLVLCASARHRERVLALGGTPERVRLMHDGHDDTRGLDLTDPYGCDDATHELVAALIERAMDGWAARLAPDV